ncbi:hypothetical protein MMC13_000546 [Lambiella insularis]|nr:hypothetical protein [Lambiella insularis]
MSTFRTPDGYLGFGKTANCTLAVCDVKYSVFQYDASLAANAIFLALFAISGLIHLYQGIRAKQWFYMSAAVLGCITEIIGYAGRIELHGNPFNFDDFLIQVVSTPSALSIPASILNGTPGYSYRVTFSIALQGAGGGLSSGSSGNTGGDVSLAGLAFQVFILCVFIAFVFDFMLRWRSNGTTVLTARFKLFAMLLSLAIILILARSAYRIDELSDGYNGSIFHDESSFVVSRECKSLFQ